MDVKQRVPVILVHGFKDNARKMRRMADYLEKTGWEAHAVTLAPSWGQAGLDELAIQLEAKISDLVSDAPFHLVGFSMGGLISRYYIQRLGGYSRVRKFITIASPHHGTLLAPLLRNAGCRQMCRNSDFLRELNGDLSLLEKVEFTSIWTPFDLMILPANSSRMPVGREVIMPILAHPLMVWQKRCIQMVAEILAESGSEQLNAAA